MNKLGIGCIFGEIYGVSNTEETLVKAKYDALSCYSSCTSDSHESFTQNDEVSPGKISHYKATAVGGYIEYKLPNVAAGKYTVSLRSRDYTGRAVMSVSINGEVINSAFDSNNATYNIQYHDNIGSFT